MVAGFTSYASTSERPKTTGLPPAIPKRRREGRSRSRRSPGRAIRSTNARPDDFSKPLSCVDVVGAMALPLIASALARGGRPSSLALLVGIGLLVACSDDPSAGPPATPPSNVDAGDGGSMAGERMFEVTIENVSGEATVTTPVSPGVFATHDGSFSLFAPGMPDLGAGLQRIAEDGSPNDLAATLTGNGTLLSKGTFDTPVGDAAMGPATPGKRFVFTVTASQAKPSLSFSTMFGQSNDWFFAPDATGIPLFDASGQPLAERDVTDLVKLWDVGSEINQMPGMGPTQGPRQAAPDTGPAEGVLAPFADSTRSIPSARSIASLSVTVDNGTFTVTVKNVSGPGSSIASGISPVFHAVHDASWSLFAEGQPASSGLERLAEDGDGPALAAAQQNAAGTSTVAAAAVPDGASTAGPALPGASFTFTVKPDAQHRFLSIASMVGESNDAFLSFGPKGVALLDENGSPRPTTDLIDDFARSLAVWDAGTEANEVPGVGAHQAPRQAAANSGDADPQSGVRRYADATNDLATGAGGVVGVTVSAGPDDAHLTVTITNESAATPFPGRASPVVWAVHSGDLAFLKPNEAAAEGIEHLAEDGNPTAWNASLEGAPGVVMHGIADTPMGKDSAGPIGAGERYSFVVPVGGSARYLDFAQMWTPSNDTFLSLGAKGVALVDTAGATRALADINTDIQGLLSAWDAGTEANQAAALGPDQAPRQASPNTGANEGGGKVRLVDPTWGMPPTRHLLRVHVKPL